jgi:opacity protein-like surface antigen
MRKFKVWAAVIAVCAATTGTALAQSPDDPTKPIYTDPADDPTQTTVTPPAPPPAPAPTVVVVPPPAPAPQPVPTYESEAGRMYDMRRVGFSLAAGGGVADFTDQEMRDTTGTGGTWAVRATIGTKTPLGFEGSYIGSAQQIDALGIDNDALLVSNGLQGALRLNAVTGAPITPFLFGGVAWSRFDLTNTSTNTSAISGEDNLLEIPVGLGIGGSWKGFGYDLRGELRFATNENMVPELSAGRDTGKHADMHRWGVNASIGYGF